MLYILVSCDIFTHSSSGDYHPATKRLRPLSRTSMAIQSEVTPSTTPQQETTPTPSTSQETTPSTSSYTTVLSTQVMATTTTTPSTTTPSVHTEPELISLNNSEPADEMTVDDIAEPTVSMTSLSPVQEEGVLTADLANVVSDEKEQTEHVVGGDNNPETGSGTQEPENAEVLPEQEVDLAARSEGDGDMNEVHKQELPSEGKKYMYINSIGSASIYRTLRLQVLI